MVYPLDCCLCSARSARPEFLRNVSQIHLSYWCGFILANIKSSLRSVLFFFTLILLLTDATTIIICALFWWNSMPLQMTFQSKIPSNYAEWGIRFCVFVRVFWSSNMNFRMKIYSYASVVRLFLAIVALNLHSNFLVLLYSLFCCWCS